MKWKGTVSQREKITIAARLSTEKTAHATSTPATGQRRPGVQCRPAGRCGQCRPDGRCGTCRPDDRWGTCRSAGGPAPLGGEPVSLTTHRLDQVEAEFGAQPPHTDIHNVRAGIKVVAPDRGQQLALAYRV